MSIKKRLGRRWLRVKSNSRTRFVCSDLDRKHDKRSEPDGKQDDPRLVSGPVKRIDGLPHRKRTEAPSIRLSSPSARRPRDKAPADVAASPPRKNAPTLSEPACQTARPSKAGKRQRAEYPFRQIKPAKADVIFVPKQQFRLDIANLQKRQGPRKAARSATPRTTP